MQNKRLVVLLSFIAIMKSIVTIAQAFLSKLLIDAAIKKEDILVYSIIFVSLILILSSLILVGNILKKKLQLQIEVKMKNKLFDTLIYKDIKELKKYHSGQISNYYLVDINNIMIGEAETIPSIFLYASRFLFSLIAFIIIDYKLLIALFLIGILAFICATFYTKYMKKYAKKSLESDGEVNAYMQESYENIKFIKAMHSENNIEDNLSKKLSNNYKIKNKRDNVALIGSTGIATVLNFSLAITIIYGAYELKYNPDFTYGTLLALSQLVSYFETPLSALSSILNRMTTYRVSKKRIQELFELKEDYKQENITDFESIIFDNISFGYDIPLYQNFSYKINKGDKVLIKGSSGKGKSTLFNLLLGFEDLKEGHIYIETKEGKYESKYARSLFSYVAQENIMFSGTIRENMKLFIDEWNEDEVLEVLDEVCVLEEIQQKEKGLDTKLNERGNGLSLGQIQRILLAICLLKNKNVLLLDEFTSSLDKNLERKIVENLMKRNSTMIIITHRDIDVLGAKIINLDEF